jgi:hypothetical protein
MAPPMPQVIQSKAITLNQKRERKPAKKAFDRQCRRPLRWPTRWADNQ